MGIAYGAKSDIGLKRTQNEDRFCIDLSLGLYMVCDGMGGHQAGEVASGLAVEVVQKHLLEGRRDTQAPIIGHYDASFLSQTNRLASAIRLANQAIHCEAHHRIDWARMGTTVVSAVITGQILSDNAPMLAFIRRLGFEIRRIPDEPDVVEARLNL